MKKLGLNPADIKYAVVSHAHPDHDGGARFLQDHFRTRVIMSPADWEMLDKRTIGTKPKLDMEATDGQKLTLGDIVMMHVYLAADPATGKMDFSGFMGGYTQFFGTKDQPNKPAEQGEKQAFGKQLPDEPPTSGTERATQSEFPFACDAPRQLEIRHVRAADQQQETNPSHERKQRTADMTLQIPE